MPLRQALNFFTCRISGPRCRVRFLVDDGAAMMVASPMVPSFLQPYSLLFQVALNLRKQSLTQVVLFQQVVEM